MEEKAVSLTILGIVAVIAIVGLVLLFSGASTGGIMIGKSGSPSVQTWGKAIKTVSATKSCFLSTGALGQVKTFANLQTAKVLVEKCEKRQTVPGTQQEYCCPPGVA